MKRICLLTALLSLAAARPSRSAPVFKGFDLYRSEALTEEGLAEPVSPMVKGYAQARAARSKGASKAAERLKERIEAELRRLAPLAYAGLHYAEYVSSGEHAAYVTLDLVDAKDKARRMPFRKAPSEKISDPGGLLAAWKRYAELGAAMRRENILESQERASCPAFFCPWGSTSPELAELEKKFSEGAGLQKTRLLEVAARQADPQARAAALYILSYLSDGPAVVEIMGLGLEDPAEEARAAALQVLSDIGLYHKDIPLDIEKVLPALDDPAASIRSRAMGVVVAVAERPAYRPTLLARAAPALLGLLKLRQPSQHDLAFTILSVLSGQTYGRRDYPAWEAWVSSQIAAPVAAPPSAP